MGKDQWAVFRVVCGKCGSTVTTRHQYDWARCKCCSVYVLGNVDPAIGGDPSAVLTAEGVPFFGKCERTNCDRPTWGKQSSCKKHRTSKDREEYYLE